MAYIYPPELSDALLSFGLSPKPHTPPSVAREAIDDMYKFELRRLRARLLTGEFDRPKYVEAIVLLRKKYWMLTLPLRAWERICRVDDAPASTE